MAKRRIYQNIYGNWVGYIGTRRRQEEFGDHTSSEQDAKNWLKTGERQVSASYNS